MLNRKGNPVRLSMFSFITAQHQQILSWLGTLPFVDVQRIAFYGLSYGGETAVRVQALGGNSYLVRTIKISARRSCHLNPI
jgi:dienelactone hydrolase